MQTQVHPHAKIIDALGGGGEVSRWITRTSGEQISDAAVRQWRQGGIPDKRRGLILQMLDAKGKRDLAPEDFVAGIPLDAIAPLRAA